MDKLRLADGREIQEHYTPGMAKSWLTPKMGPDGVETFEPYNNMHPVRLAESFVIYADRTLRRLKEQEGRIKDLELNLQACSDELAAERQEANDLRVDVEHCLTYHPQQEL